jgi:hypothetical protein
MLCREGLSDSWRTIAKPDVAVTTTGVAKFREAAMLQCPDEICLLLNSPIHFDIASTGIPVWALESGFLLLQFCPIRSLTPATRQQFFCDRAGESAARDDADFVLPIFRGAVSSCLPTQRKLLDKEIFPDGKHEPQPYLVDQNGALRFPLKRPRSNRHNAVPEIGCRQDEFCVFQRQRAAASQVAPANQAFEAKNLLFPIVRRELGLSLRVADGGIRPTKSWKANCPVLAS